MDKPFYDFQILEENLRFDFISEGEKTIRKVILYRATSETLFFQLALVDIMEDGSFSDSVRSNNGDRNKVLATVVQTLRFFFERYPEGTIIFSGSDEIRTRLYERIISNELENESNRFEFLGFNGTYFEFFTKNKDYKAFGITLK
jgi:hypothetical protein